MKKFKWTEEEDQLLRQLAQQKVALGLIAHKLRRSRPAVIARATKLKVPLIHTGNGSLP
jgi:hypothetical protein